ncbi:MAG: CsiV family protein [Gammaproteobacteria bacterium]
MITLQSLASLTRKTSQPVMACIALALTLAGSSMVLAEVPIYDVEVIVFSNQNSGDDGERWPMSVRDDIGARGFAAQGQISERPASSYQLGGIAYELTQSRGYTVLLHTAWRQPAYGSGNAIGYAVDIDVQNGTRQLAGRINLVRERHLHLDVDLSLSSADSPVYELSERRRIKKSGRVHYFDHPRFGMIAILTRYQSPQMQQQLLEEEEREAADAAEEVVADEEPLPADDQLTR